MAKTKSPISGAVAVAAMAQALNPFTWTGAAEPTRRYSQVATSNILRRERVSGKRGNAPRRRPVNKWHKKPRRAFLVIRANHPLITR